MECITPDIVFEHIGLDFAGPLQIKREVRYMKSCVCVFVSMSMKAVHLELVSDLSTELFLACLQRFIARRGKPSSIKSNHGTNFVGKQHVLKELYALLTSNNANETF